MISVVQNGCEWNGCGWNEEWLCPVDMITETYENIVCSLILAHLNIVIT